MIFFHPLETIMLILVCDSCVGVHRKSHSFYFVMRTPKYIQNPYFVLKNITKSHFGFTRLYRFFFFKLTTTRAYNIRGGVI